MTGCPRLLAFALPLLLVSGLFAEPSPVLELAEAWSFHGQGVRRMQNRMLYMAEAKESQGVMLISPESFAGDLVLRYEIMPLNPGTVAVALLSASDGGKGEALTLPPDYDGGMGVWTRDIHNYFFAFHNATHDRTPFGVRFPSGLALGEHPVNVMRSGEFSVIEVGRREGLLWLAINGVRLFEGRDDDPLPGGHIALRLRGIQGMPAAALIRNLTLERN
jgi:hypothetical protein